MPGRALTSVSETLASERGFTLVELLVVLIAGLATFSALMAILDVTMRGTQRVTSRVNATQESRTALARIENELHSSCTGNNVPPIQPNSDDSNLNFVDAYGSAASVTPVTHTISFDAAQRTLTETTGANTTTLLGNVEQVDATTPVFQYFAYEAPRDSPGRTGTPYLDPSGNEYRMLLDGDSSLPSGATLGGAPVAPNTIPANSPLPLGTPLSDADSDPNNNPSQAAAVLINLKVFPSGGLDVNPDSYGAGATVKDMVVMRLTPVANHAGGAPNLSPCA